MPGAQHPLSPLEYHVLMAVAPSPLYGYAIRESVERDSAGVLSPRTGTLYRVIARLVSAGWVMEADSPSDAEPHPGHARRYYGLTANGKIALASETQRLQAATELANALLRQSS